jgi:hypothetical protein
MKLSKKLVSFDWFLALSFLTSYTYWCSLGEMVIYNMREKRPAYNIISNNCQNFALLMLNAIQIGSHREFGTAFAIYQRAIGAGRVKDLFLEDNLEEQKYHEQSDVQCQDTVQVAQQVMEENTTKLDNHHSLLQS